MVVLIRCNDIASDPRAMKYVRYYQQNDIEYKLIGWNRDNINVDLENTYYFKKKAGFNVGGLKAVYNRTLWMIFVIRTLLSFQEKNLVIHACDLDCAFPASIFKSLSRSKIILIFDVFDWFSATLFDQNKLVVGSFKVMERFSTKKSDRIIICEDERIEQIPYAIEPEKLSVLPNIPMFSNREFLYTDGKYKFENNNITFSYVGGFSQDRSLEEIINIAESGRINLLIAGFGDAKIEAKLKSLGSSKTIKYFGKVAYQDGLRIMYNSDIVYAMYQKCNPNHIYAAPNKYYEAMFLGKPLFSTKGTIIENKVKSNDIGYVSEESEEDIIDSINSISREDLDTKGNRALKLWMSKFQNYTSAFLKNFYFNVGLNNNTIS